jgi:hypothetical protein
MGQSGDKHPVDIELHRPQLDMGLLKKAVAVERQLEQVGQMQGIGTGQGGRG